MTIDLSSASAKFSRAEHHLQNLDAEIRQFLDSQPYEVVELVDTDARDPFGNPAIDHTFRVRVVRQRPPTWELAIGDCLHNFRCAVDHLAWTLAGSSSRDSTTMFPIFQSSGAYKTYAPRYVERIKDPDVLATIKELQPFEASRDDSGGDALWVLHELERVDKHRQLVVVSTATTTRYGAWQDKPAELIVGYDMLAGHTPFQDGAVLARYNLTLDRNERPPDMKMEMGFAFDIALDPKGPARGVSVVEGLTKIGVRTAQVLERFEGS